MAVMIRRIALLLTATLGAACGSPATPPPAAKAPAPAATAQAPAAKPGTPAPAASSPAAVVATAGAVMSSSPPKYDPQGRRDPFESLESRFGSDKSTVETSKLTGVVLAPGGALALIETADGIGYILKAGDTLADGRLVELSANTAVFTLAPKPGATTNRVVLRLAGD